MKRVLLLDSSFAARPVHDWLLEIGCDVWTIGNRPDDLLARRNPDRYIQANYADPALVQPHIDAHEIEYVVPGCTDISIETAQQLKGHKTELDSAEVYRQLAEKSAFRAVCAALDLPAPVRVPLEEFPRPGRYIAKPSDAFSGRGISVFDGEDSKEAESALAHAREESRNGEALIETYADGQLYSYSCFIEDEAVTDGAIVIEDGSVTPYAVDTSHLVDDFPSAGIAALDDALGRLASHLGLVDGFMHVQFIWDGEKPWLIELSRRCPGDLYPRLVELSTGSPHAARYASYYVGEKVTVPPLKRRYILRHTVTAGHDNYEGIWFGAPAPVVEFHALAAAGRQAPPNDRIDRVALTFLEMADETELKKQHRKLQMRQAYLSSGG